jgi:hypothetical protein
MKPWTALPGRNSDRFTLSKGKAEDNGLDADSPLIIRAATGKSKKVTPSRKFQRAIAVTPSGRAGCARRGVLPGSDNPPSQSPAEGGAGGHLGGPALAGAVCVCGGASSSLVPYKTGRG